MRAPADPSVPDIAEYAAHLAASSGADFPQTVPAHPVWGQEQLSRPADPAASLSEPLLAKTMFEPPERFSPTSAAPQKETVQ